MTNEAIENGPAGRTAWLARLLPAFVLALFATATYELYQHFASLRLIDLEAAIDSLSPGQILVAVILALFGYVVLVGYDATALRTIGKRLPLSSIAIGSFAGYAIGNTVGLSVLSGNAVRYRVYSRYGLDAADIAVVAVYCALAFGFGEALSAFIAIAAEPDIAAAVFQSSNTGLLRLGAIVGLVALLAAAYALSLAKGSVTIAGGRLEVLVTAVFFSNRPEMLFGLLGLLLAVHAGRWRRLAIALLYAYLVIRLVWFTEFLADALHLIVATLGLWLASWLRQAERP